MSFNPELNPGAAETEAFTISDRHVVLESLTGYINAGGRGVRLSSIFPPHEKLGVSKALLPIGKPPITLVEHQINKMDHAGVPTIVAGVGDHENVAEHVRSVYAGRSGIYAVSHQNQLGTGGDLVRAIRERRELFADNVLITCVDTLLDVDEAEFFKFHREKGAELSIALTTKAGVPNEGAYYVDRDDNVAYCAEANWNIISQDAAAKRSAYRASSTGAMIASTDMLGNLDWQAEDGPLPLDKGIVASVIGRGTMFAFNNGDRLFTDIGTVPSWNDAQTHQDMIAPYIHYATGASDPVG